MPRPLRQFYAPDRRLELHGLGDAVAPFRRHRERFLAALAGLDDEQWNAVTRCDAWSAKDVVNHLVSADGFWVLTLQGRRAPEPTTYLRGFDPTATPDTIVAPMRAAPTAEILDSFAASTESLTSALAEVGPDEWTVPSESPFGHVPVRAIAAHSLWDSWLHERDVLLPLGREPEVAEDELLTAAAFTLYFAGTQGGTLHDPDPVGDGPPEGFSAKLAFSDLPGWSLALSVDRDVEVSVRTGDDGDAAGSAVTFVEATTGRAPVDEAFAPLPAPLVAQLERARQIL